MSAKHTPGPWQIAIQTCHTGDIATVHQTTDGWVGIWSENWAATGMPPEEQSANARLIAAAPDLLEALQQLVGMDDARSWGVFGVDAKAPLENARVAIAKATGQQS